MAVYIKLSGAVCIVCAGVLAGLYSAREYGKRVKEIEAMLGALHYMQAEISLRLTPMDSIFGRLARVGKTCDAFFAELEERLVSEDEYTLSALWQEACGRHFTASRQREIFEELGLSLGCYDAQNECEAIAYACDRLTEELGYAKEDNVTRGTLMRRLGTCAGIGAAIVFL